MKVQWENALRLANKTTALQAAQEIAGIRFDAEKARALLERIRCVMSEIEADVQPKLPPRALKKSEESEFTLPAKPFKMDGSFSHHMLKFLERHGIEANATERTLQWQGQTETIVGGKLLPATKPMTLSNQDDLKDWLLECNWKPTYWNFKKGADGKPERGKNGEYTKTSPKIQEAQKICPNLIEMQGDLIKQVVKWLSCRNRCSVLEGWLANERLAFDGRLTAGISGITNTHRVKHSVVANLPKADGDVLFGFEMRDLFCADEGEVCIGYDAAGIESRNEAHFCFKYPGGEEYARELLEGDIHTKTAIAVFKDKLGSIERHKDNPLFKPFRHKAKTLKYATLYGAQPKKIASTLNVSVKEAEAIYAAFWESAAPLAAFRDALWRFWETQGNKQWIVGIDGRKLHTRSKHSVMNTLFQNTGAVVMDLANAKMDKDFGGLIVRNNVPTYRYKGFDVKRRIFYHDEALWTAPLDIAEEIGIMGVNSIKWAGKHLKMNVPLDGEYKIGKSWAEVH